MAYEGNDGVLNIDESDQIFKITNKVDINPDTDYSHFTDEQQIKYFKEIKNLSTRESPMRDQYPETSDELHDVLKQLLEFNHYYRPTARELLANPIFDKIRIESIEEPAPHKIVIDIDKNEFK